MKNFDKKVYFPITYGDTNIDEKMLSDFVVELMKSKRFQSYITAVFFALIALGSCARPSAAIPPEYGEAVNGVLDQAAQHGAAAPPIGPIQGRVPPVGQMQGQVPVAQANSQFILPAMSMEQQRVIAAQQAGIQGPTNPPSFYVPDKPRLRGPRIANTAAFTTALGVICLNAAWGEPVAIIMCSTGLMGLTYRLGKEVVVFMAKNLK